MNFFKSFLRRLPWEKTLMAGAVIVVLFIVAGFIPISHDGLRRLIVSTALRQGVERFELDRVSVTLWRGLRLQGLRLATVLPTGHRVETETELAVVSYSIFPLVFKHVHIKKFLLESPKIKLTLPGSQWRPKPAAPAPAPKPEPLSFSLTCRTIAVEGAEVMVYAEGRRQLSVSGIDVEGKFSLKGSPHLEGLLEIRQCRLVEHYSVEKIQVEFSATPERVALTRCEGKVLGGKFDGRAQLNPAANRLAFFELDVHRLDLSEYYRATGIAYGKLDGSLNLHLRLGESVIDPDSLSGKGRVEMKNVRVEELPMQKNPVIRLSMPELTHIRFETIRGDIVLRKGRAYNAPVAGVGSPMDFDANGWVGLNGYFDQTLDARLEATFAHRLPQLVRNGLVVRPDGSYGMKLYLSGTMENPKVRIDKQNVNQAIGRSLETLGRGLRRFLR